MDAAPSRSTPSRLIFWMLWLAMVVVVTVLRFKLAPDALVERGPSPVRLPEAAVYAVLVVPVVLAIAVRMMLLPRQPEAGKVLVNFVLSLALAEAPVVLTSFLAPERADIAYLAFLSVWLLNTPAFIRSETKPAR